MPVPLPEHVEPLSAVEPSLVRRVLKRADVADWTQSVDRSWRTGRKPNFPAALMVAMVAVRRWSYRGERCIGWNAAVRLVAEVPELREACGRAGKLPSLHACERFERKHRVALDALLGPAESAVREWTHGEIVRAMRDWHAAYGGWPSANDWNPAAIKSEQRRMLAEARYRDQGVPSTRAVQIAFGSWRLALKAAQQPVRQGQRREFRETVADHEKQASRPDWASGERPKGSRSPSVYDTVSLDAPLGDEGASLYEVLAAQGALEDEDA